MQRADVHAAHVYGIRAAQFRTYCDRYERRGPPSTVGSEITRLRPDIAESAKRGPSPRTDCGRSLDFARYIRTPYFAALSFAGRASANRVRLRVAKYDTTDLVPAGGREGAYASDHTCAHPPA